MLKFNQLIPTTMISILFVGTAENRFFIENDRPIFDDMPNLIDKDGQLFYRITIQQI